MPIGSYAAVPPLAQALLELRPKSVLDLGIGFGGGGVLVRERLDLGVRPWSTYLVGVEAWADYRNPVWDLYDVVYAQTIEQFLAGNTETFDCVLLCDVLEHFHKPAGEKALEAIQSRVAAGGRLLVTTPTKYFRQGRMNGNKWERHRSAWSQEDLTDLGFRVKCVGRPEYFCGQCWFAEWRKGPGRS